MLFNAELQLKNTESEFNSTLMQLLLQLKGFKVVTTLLLVFKKIESEDKTDYDNFYSSSKAEININESDIDDVFQSINLYYDYNKQTKIFRKKVHSGLLMQSLIKLLIFQSIIP